MDQRQLIHSPQQGNISDISGWTIIRYFFISIVLVAISDVPQNWGTMFYVAQGVIGLLLAAVVLLPFRNGLLLLLLLAIAGKDIIASEDFGQVGAIFSTASIWQMQLGPIRPSWIMFACLFAKIAQSKIITVPSSVKRTFLWFATVPLITGLFYGGFFNDQAMTEAVIDLKFPLMLLASTVLFLTSYKNDKRYFGLILCAFIGALFARHLADLVLFAANFGPAIAEGISRGSEDSAKGCVVFLVFFGVCLLSIQRRLLTGLLISIPAILLLAAYGTRMLWITFLIGAIILLIHLELRRSVSIILVILLLTVSGIGMLFLVNQESAEVITARSKMITQGRSLNKFDVNVQYNLISRIDPIRYAEALNIVDSIGRRGAYLWGTGYGGFYEDSAVDFPPDLKSSFPQYSLISGNYYRAHGYPTQIFLKHGLVGLIIISAFWLIPWFSLLRIFKKKQMFQANRPRLFNITMLCVGAFLPTAMLQLYWSGKGLFINGIIIASCLEYTLLNYSSSKNVRMKQHLWNRNAS